MALARGSDLLLAHSTALLDGGRVRLRIARRRDSAGIAALLDQVGEVSPELETARLVRFDPRRRFVVCATRLLAGREVVVGVGAIELGEDAVAEPSVLIVEDGLGDELRDLIRGALVSRAIASTRVRAA